MRHWHVVFWVFLGFWFLVHDNSGYAGSLLVWGMITMAMVYKMGYDRKK